MSKTNTMVAGNTAAAADVNQNFDELGLLDYAEAVANQGTFTAETDLTGLTVTVNISTAFAAAGRKIKITGHVGLQSSVGSDQVRMNVKEGTTVLQEAEDTLSGTANRATKVIAVAVITPTSGSHTYKLSALRVAGTGNITMVASATRPAFILVEAI